MNYWTYSYLLVAIILETIGTSALQLTMQFTKPLPTLFMALSYLGAFYTLSFVLRTMPVGLAYAIWSGLGIVLISLIGIFAFQQKLDLPACLGIGLIIIGVIVINVFSKSLMH